MNPIKMVDLARQYQSIQDEVDSAIRQVLSSTDFIQGQAVKEFEASLSAYLDGCHVVSCGNGTDALQIAMMALDFTRGDEIILPVYTYVATAEVVAHMGLVPVFADVDPYSFNLDVTAVEKLISKKTVGIVPVHLFGQCAHMEPLISLSEKHNIHLIEDAAQSLGAEYFFGTKRCKAGTMGVIGTTSFFPSKNLGAFGDGGAILTRRDDLASKMRMIANHGQSKKYHHDLVGINSRLDTLQAAILKVKLSHLAEYTAQRQGVAAFYDEHLRGVDFLDVPARMPWSTHVYHQYTVKLRGADRDQFRGYLNEKGVPSMIYYPVPLHLQNAYRRDGISRGSFPVAEQLADTVLSLPIHTEMDETQLSYICDCIKKFR